MSVTSRVFLVILLMGLTGIAAGFESKSIYAACVVVGGFGFVVVEAIEKEIQ